MTRIKYTGEYMTDIRDITSDSEIDSALQSNMTVIFKNSTACPVSATARREFRKFAESCGDSIQLYMVDVIAKRQLSEEVAERTGIRHESPQILVLKSGTVTWHGSHWQVTKKNIQSAIES